MFFPSSFICFFISQIIVFQLVDSHCPKQFLCAKATFSFPFSKSSEPNCGLILLDCDEWSGKIQMQPGGYWRLYRPAESETLWMYPPFDQNENNCSVFNNITLPENNPAISFSTTLPNFTMLKCNTSSSRQSLNALSGYKNFTQCGKEHGFNIYYNYNSSDGVISSPVGNDYPSGCSIIQWPIVERVVGNLTFNPQVEQQLFHIMDKKGVPLKWSLYGSCKDCYSSSGQRCKVNHQNYTCSKDKHTRMGFKLGAWIAISFVGIVILTIVSCCLRRHYSVNHSIVLGKNNLDQKTIEDFLRNHRSLGPKRYSYSDIKKMTSSFKHKIGQGGFGSVFKGCLIDRSPVAVKLLNGNKRIVEEFINEVASISRTSHVNIVKLLGFCFQGNKRALVYEFMSNGSLEKFIFDGNNQLEVPELFKIAVGIARGLEYLHRLCGTQIVHFDVKPHNVLLNDDFTPKISDFGLAKSNPQEYVTNNSISLSTARGTIGYIAPEVVCRHLGNVSHKSDVYSYGMMVLEIVGGRRNVDNGNDNSSQVYMPHWIYNQIETNQDVNFLHIANDEDVEIARKMIIVSFWCIQTDPSSRPTMTRVVEMLEARPESLQIPPRPHLFSEVNSSVYTSTV